MYEPASLLQSDQGIPNCSHSIVNCREPYLMAGEDSIKLLRDYKAHF